MKGTGKYKIKIIVDEELNITLIPVFDLQILRLSNMFMKHVVYLEYFVSYLFYDKISMPLCLALSILNRVENHQISSSFYLKLSSKLM